MGIGDKRPLDSIGLQLYTLRKPLAEDFEGTLRQVAGLGYREVEFAGYFERDPAEGRSCPASPRRTTETCPST